MNIPKTGQSVSVGLVVTRSLVILGDGQVTNPGGRPRGAMLRAYNKTNGAEVGAVFIPAAQSGSPMSYQVGRQAVHRRRRERRQLFGRVHRVRVA